MHVTYRTYVGAGLFLFTGCLTTNLAIKMVFIRLAVIRYFKHPAGSYKIAIRYDGIEIQDSLYARFEIMRNPGQVVPMNDCVVRVFLPSTAGNLAEFGIIQFV